MISSVYGSNRITMGGLATGLDTQSLIKQMTYATRLKIDSKKQSIQTLQWKTDSYREVTSSLNSLKEKYFSYSSKSNLLSSSLYTNGKISCSSPYVTISGSSSSAQNLIIKDIQQLATKTTLTTNGTLTDSSIQSEVIEFDKQVNNLAAESVTLSYNGKNYSVVFGKDFSSTDPAEIAAYINDSLKQNSDLLDESGNLKISVQIAEGDTAGSQVFSITNNTGDGKTVKIAAGTKNALAALGFAVSSASATEIKSSEITADQFTSTLNLIDTLRDNFLKIKLDGSEKTITFEDVPSNLSTTEELSNYLNQKLSAVFSPGKVSVMAVDGQIVIRAVSQSSVVSVTGGGEGLLGPKGVLGLASNESNRVNTNAPVSDIPFSRPLLGDTYTVSINSKEFSFDKDTSLSTIISTINSSDVGVKLSYSSTMNKMMVESTSTGANSKIEISDVSGNLAECLLGTNYTVNQGTDAVVVVSLDGGQTEMTVARSSNTFTMDGLSITLNSKAAGDVAEDIRVTVESNADELVSTFKSFVDDYNSLIDMMNGHLKTKPDRDYQPLTDEQKEEMTEKEIELWEKKAKDGLLYADNDIHSLVTDMKSCLTSLVGDAGLLSEFGIKFDQYLTGGKLSIDEDKFKKALTENPDKLISCLTQKSTVNKTDDYKGYYASSGVFQRMSETIDKYASTYLDKGILVKKAGVANTSTDQDNYLARQIKDYNKQISKLQRILAIEENRYLKQFTALETNINNLNSQSSLFTSGQ